MEAEKIKVIKDWLESKSIRNIWVFLGFANFYQRFIQGFNKIGALLISMLKMTELPDKPAFSINDGSRSASNKNNNNRLVFGKNDGNGEFDGFGISRNGMKHTKKSRKLSKSKNLSKSRKSKSKKTFKSQNLAKLGKILSKNRNLTNFDTTEAGSKFLTLNIRTAFNHL